MIVKRYLSLILALICALMLCACGSSKDAQDTGSAPVDGTAAAEILPAVAVDVKEDGEYYTRDEVAAYIHLFRHLPSNFITKKDARELGWQR